MGGTVALGVPTPELLHLSEKFQGRDAVNRQSCSIEDCDNDVIALGWCWKHYQANRRYGDPLGKAKKRPRKTECRIGNADGRCSIAVDSRADHS